MTTPPACLLAATAMIAVTAFAGSAAYASAFLIKEQSVPGVGRAFAGEAAVGDDATTIFFNPAGLTRLERAEVDIGAHLLLIQSDIRDRGSVIGPTFSIPTGGGDGGDPYDPALVPNLYGAFPLFDRRLWIGIGVTAPFGLANKYNSDWFGRYDAIKSKLTTINAAPTIAYRVNEIFSLGAGVDIQQVDAELTNAVPTPASIRVGAAGDVIARLKGDDISVGYNLGAMLEPLPSTRIGLHYRSGMFHTVEGSVIVHTRDGVQLSHVEAAADLDLPDIVGLGIAHQATSKLLLLGEVKWHRWSNFEEIRVVNRLTGAVVSDVEQNFDDTFSVSAGAEYALADRWTVRAGYQYDETPTRAEFRSLRVPDGDRNWLATGASNEINERFVIDAAYAHVFVQDVDTNAFRFPGSPGAGLGSNTMAASEGSVDIVSLGLRSRF